VFVVGDDDAALSSRYFSGFRKIFENFAPQFPEKEGER